MHLPGSGSYYLGTMRTTPRPGWSDVAAFNVGAGLKDVNVGNGAES